MVNRHTPVNDQANIVHNDTSSRKRDVQDDLYDQAKRDEAQQYEKLCRENFPDYRKVEEELMPNRKQRRAAKGSVDK
jgi:hypothetical protein